MRNARGTFLTMFDGQYADFENFDLGSPQVLSEVLIASSKKPSNPSKVDKPAKQPRDPFPKIDDVADRLTGLLIIETNSLAG